MRVVAELDICEDCMVTVDRTASDLVVDCHDDCPFARFRCGRCGEWIEGTQHQAVQLAP